MKRSSFIKSLVFIPTLDMCTKINSTGPQVTINGTGPRMTINKPDLITTNRIVEYYLNEGSGQTINNIAGADGDLTFGYSGAVEAFDPSWNSRGIAMSSQFAQGTFAAPVSFTNLTCYVLAKLPKNVTKQSYALMETYNTGKFLVKWGSGGNLDSTSQPSFRFGASQLTAYTSKLSDDKVHLISCTYDGTRMKMYCDGGLIINFTATPSPFTMQHLIMSAESTLAEYFNGEIYYASIFDTAHSKAQIDQQFTALQSVMSLRGVAMTKLDKFIVYEGDSISAVGSAGIWPRIVSRLMENPVQGFCQALTGSQVVNPVSLESRALSTDTYLDSTRTINLLVILIGANDLVSKSGATVHGHIKSYCLARRAAGWDKIALGVPLPRFTTGFAANRAAYIALLESDNDFVDELIRFDQIPGMGADGDELNTTYFSDGVHPTPAGYALMAPVALPVIETLLI